MEHATVDLAPLLLMQAAGQLLLALVLAALLLAFQRVYRTPLPRHWALSWIALAAFMADLGRRRARAPATTRARATCSRRSRWCPRYLQIAWLLLGARRARRAHATCRPRTVTAVVALAVLLRPAQRRRPDARRRGRLGDRPAQCARRNRLPGGGRAARPARHDRPRLRRACAGALRRRRAALPRPGSDAARRSRASSCRC